MRKHKFLSLLITFGLFLLMIYSSSVLAEKKTSKSEVSEEVTSTDEMAEVFKHYFAMRELLAQDKVDQVSVHAQKMSTQLDELIKALETIKTSSSDLKADDLENARKGFAPLSQSMLSYLKQFGYSGKVYSFHCSMAKGGSWLQENGQIGNPYYGSGMYKCGEMTGMTVNGKYMVKSEGKSSMHMHKMEGK